MLKGEEAIIDAIATLFTARTGVEIRSNRFEFVKSRLFPRLKKLKLANFSEYKLHFERNEETELHYLIAQLTTHHTEFFRESRLIQHFVDSIVTPALKMQMPIRVWSAGTSTGEESYSLAIAIAEAMQKIGFSPKHYAPGVSILGTDVDNKSINIAKNGVYFARNMETVSSLMREKWFERGRGELADQFRVTEEIYRMCHFKVRNLLYDDAPSDLFNAVFCRNVFIYFNQFNIDRVLKKISMNLIDRGQLYLGYAETLARVPEEFQEVNQGIYAKRPNQLAKANNAKVGKIRVLIVDDSKTVRSLLREILQDRPEFEIVADVGNTESLRAVLARTQVDVVTLDINMPEESGIAYLESINVAGILESHPPVVMISSVSSKDSNGYIRCTELGAIAYIEKPTQMDDEVTAMAVVATLLAAAGRGSTFGEKAMQEAVLADQAPVLKSASKALALGRRCILIGASTGGPLALMHLLKDFPADFPPVVIAQHIPADFVRALVDYLVKATGKKIILARQDLPLLPSTIYILPGGHHGSISIRDQLCIELTDEPALNGHKPAVNRLFRSAIPLAKERGVVALLLTGMGEDGADGMLELRQNGAVTICQNKGSSAVYGMPRAAIARGAAVYELPLNEIAQSLFGKKRSNAA